MLLVRREPGESLQPPDVVLLSEEPVGPVDQARMDRFRRNVAWWNEHAAGLIERYRGQHIAVESGEVFVSSDPWEADRLARAKYPDGEPMLQWIPAARLPRIYAN